MNRFFYRQQGSAGKILTLTLLLLGVVFSLIPDDDTAPSVHKMDMGAEAQADREEYLNKLSHMGMIGKVNIREAVCDIPVTTMFMMTNEGSRQQIVLTASAWCMTKNPKVTHYQVRDTLNEKILAKGGVDDPLVLGK